MGWDGFSDALRTIIVCCDTIFSHGSPPFHDASCFKYNRFSINYNILNKYL